MSQSNIISRAPASVLQIRLRNLLQQGLWLPLAVVLGLTLLFSVESSSFTTLRNLTALLNEASTLLIASLGPSFVVLMGSIDLSVGATVLITGAIGVTLMNHFGFGNFIVPVTILLGAGFGLLNGTVHVLGRIPSFVVTLGTLSVFTGLGQTMLQGQAVEIADPNFGGISLNMLVPHIPNCALWGIGAWLVTVIIARFTRFGRYMYLIGGGETVARTAGVPISRYKIYAFMASGATAGLAASLLVAQLGAVGPTLGNDLLLNTLAAVVVGGTSLAGGVGGPHRTLIGVLIIAMLDNGLNLMGVNEYTQMIIKGLVVIGAVLISRNGSRAAVVK